MLSFFHHTPNHLKLSMGSASDTDSTSTIGSDSSGSQALEEDIALTITCQRTLDLVWKQLKPNGYKNVRRVHMSFGIGPNTKLHKMKHLEDVFEALGSLPLLEEVVFDTAALFLPALHKLLKKTTSLRVLKFHHCQITLAKTQKGLPKAAKDDLWKGIEQQVSLTTLEILDCHLTDNQLDFPMPSCPQDPSKLIHLRRLVLDGCCLPQGAFRKLLSACPALQELEIRPEFMVAESNCRLSYAAKKRALHTLITQTIPGCMVTNHTLSKLVLAVDDYLLATVYVDAMTQWVELVSQRNSTLTELRVSPQLGVAAEDHPSWETIGLFEDAFGQGLQVFAKNDQCKYDIGFHIQRKSAANKLVDVPETAALPEVPERAATTITVLAMTSGKLVVEC